MTPERQNLACHSAGVDGSCYKERPSEKAMPDVDAAQAAGGRTEEEGRDE